MDRSDDSSSGDRRIWTFLFLCTANSARSIIAESICNTDYAHRLRAYSAGSHPRGEVYPCALSLLEKLGHDISGLRSKGWDEFAGDDAPRTDFVFTVCDAAAGETCPVWPGQPVSAHWGVPDPAQASGSEAEVARAFHQTCAMMNRRIGIFASLPIETLDTMRLKSEIERIGDVDKAETPEPHG